MTMREIMDLIDSLAEDGQYKTSPDNGNGGHHGFGGHGGSSGWRGHGTGW